jgi:hypothetical protein
LAKKFGSAPVQLAGMPNRVDFHVGEILTAQDGDHFMTKTSAPVKNTRAMIAGMDPIAMPGVWHFVTVADEGTVARLLPDALAMMREPEGVSLLVSQDVAAREGLLSDLAMAQILLQVTSALDGIGLTAAVSGALTDANIPCNVIAGALHDHIFVPVDVHARAVDILRATAASAR